MINYSTLENIKKIDYKALLLYYIIIINNNNIISKDYQINFNKLNEIINKAIQEKEYDKIINFFLRLKNFDNIDKIINKEIIENLFKSLMKKFALVIFFIIKLIHVLMIILIY